MKFFNPKHKKKALILMSIISGTIVTPSIGGKGFSLFGMLLLISWAVLAMAHKNTKLPATTQIIMIGLSISLSILGTNIFFETPGGVVTISILTAVSLSVYSLVLHYWRTDGNTKNKKNFAERDIQFLNVMAYVALATLFLLLTLLSTHYII